MHPGEDADDREQCESDPGERHDCGDDVRFVAARIRKAGAVPVASLDRGANDPQDPENPAAELLVRPVRVAGGICIGTGDGTCSAHGHEEEHAGCEVSSATTVNV